MIISTYFGFGLADYEKQAIEQYLAARAPLSLADKEELGMPDEFGEQVAQSRLFAFWLAVGMRQQDKPVFFAVGVTFVAYAIVSTIVQVIVKIWWWTT